MKMTGSDGFTGFYASKITVKQNNTYFHYKAWGNAICALKE